MPGNVIQKLTKVCEQCGETFARPNMYTHARWAARRFCSQTCSATFRTRPFEDRVWDYVDRAEGACWTWRGPIRHTEQGRGAIATKEGQHFYAYRVVYELLVGPIPDGLVAHHTCRNANCVNPEHLELLTPGEHLVTHVADTHNDKWRAAMARCGRERRRR